MENTTKLKETKAWIVTGSYPFGEGKIDGFNLIVENDGIKYVIPSFQLEQYKVETNNK